MKIKEIIVVEGKDDTVKIKLAVNADTIETRGSAVDERVIEQVRHAQATRGVIIFTDPDYPGQRIRNMISEQVPGCRHAFLPKEEAIEKLGRGVGVEHASIESIRKALRDAQYMEKQAEEQMTMEDLVNAGLIGGDRAKARREKLGGKLKIGYANGKQLYKRLIMFQVTREQFIAALKEVMEEELR
ncbi:MULTISPECIES: ribonuclease M5 [Bacillaceae]|uniref:Ribonuclease M5 n=1 Tax=Domibacillus aminovorans TaxID=29332 RepID=A0A177KV06_9BACI|nr:MULTISPECIES: ribonuclease M5 [Bacillaceae]OAH56765.1 ribonuclease M5 [Domibacillus aminovorans]OAH61874.1 ribonuclease M5 [Domibacillus aminovorans]